MSFPSNATPHHTNYILGALPIVDLERLTPHLIPCLFHSGQTLYEQCDEVKHVYFPKSGLISLVLSSSMGVDVEVGIVGREAAVGTIEALGHNALPTRAAVQIAGSGWKLPAEVLRLECARNSTLLQEVLRAAHSLSQQTSQCVLCNRLHSIEQRLARCLLMCEDRMKSQTLELTQEILSNMLGSRRVGVTLAAGVLRKAGLIDYARGQITIIDRPGLEERACECYRVISSRLESRWPTEVPLEQFSQRLAPQLSLRS